MKGAGRAFEELAAEDLLLLDLDGAVLSGSRPRHEEWAIHAGVLRARPDVQCVVHLHPLHAVALDATGVPLRPLSHDGARLVPPDLPRFTQTSDLITTPALGASVAAALGVRPALFLRHHGIVTAAADVGTAVLLAIYLERACRTQLLAMATGRPYSWTPDDEATEKRTRVGSAAGYAATWAYLRRRLAR